MKKLLLLSIVVSGTAVTSFGQSHHMSLSNHLTSCQDHAAAKTTSGNWQRCIAEVFSQKAGSVQTPIDSVTFAYTGARPGSVMGSMKFDNSSMYFNAGGTYSVFSTTTQTFDTHDNILTKTQKDFDFSSSAFINSMFTTYTYDAMNNQLTELDQSWNTSTSAWENNTRFVNTFTAGNNLATQTELHWVGTTWQNYHVDSFTYSSTNKILLRLTKTWNTATSGWDPFLRTTATYDASDNMTSMLYELWSGSTWNDDSKVIFSNYIGAGLYQKAIAQSWSYSASAFVNAYKDSITYNSYNQPVYYFDEQWSTTTNSWNTDTSMSMHYYYELYSTGITEVNGNTTTLEVYPNPASDVINISAAIAGATHTTISLLDVTGRVVTFIGSDIREGLNNIQYPAEHLPAGVYFIHLTNDKSDITRKLVIAK